MANKQAAVSFLEMAASGKAREAFAQYVGPGFRHHNPFFRADPDELMKGMQEDAEKHPGKRLEVLRVVEEGDLVAVHSRVLAGGPDIAVVHIFRFEGDRMMELWDVGQVLPAEPVNANGAF